MLSEHNILGSRTTSTSMTRSEVYERIIRIKETADVPGPDGSTHQHKKSKLTSEKELYVRHKHDGSFYWVRYYQDHWVRPHHAARMFHSKIKRLRGIRSQKTACQIGR